MLKLSKMPLKLANYRKNARKCANGKSKLLVNQTNDELSDICCCRNGFPGCQPVSMDTMNMWKVVAMPYRVSWKADGTR